MRSYLEGVSGGQVCQATSLGPAPSRRPSPGPARPRLIRCLPILPSPALPAAAAASGDSPEAAEADEGSSAAARGGGAELQEPRPSPRSLRGSYAAPR